MSLYRNTILRSKLSGDAPVNQGLDFSTDTLTWLKLMWWEAIVHVNAHTTHSDAIVSMLVSARFSILRVLAVVLLCCSATLVFNRSCGHWSSLLQRSISYIQACTTH
jgi:hypothetical protein